MGKGLQMDSKTVAIIGAGRVGGSIGFLLKQAGYRVTAVAARTTASAEQAREFIGSGAAMIASAQAASTAEIIFITTPDGEIRKVCDEIARGNGFKQGALAVHASGAHSLDLLSAAKSAGARRAVIHPLQSVPSMEAGVKNIPGSYFRMEADPEAVARAQDIVQSLGGIELVMPKWGADASSPALYHAGAVVVSNFFVALVDYGLKFYETLGAQKQDALKAVLPLIKGTLENIETLGIPAALTGPFVRGDAATVRDHIAAMHKRAPELVPLYYLLAQRTLGVAQEKGVLTREAFQALATAIENAGAVKKA
jgi:predicted short-subunit dehydrogenase-like oxidoreductase (DUF2520 family)